MTVISSRVARAEVVELTEAGLDPFGEVLGQGPQGGMFEVAALVDQRPQQADDKQRAAPARSISHVTSASGTGPPVTDSARSSDVVGRECGDG